jgi:LmbE family N-acetylglucosaminyl deacetylase
VRSAEAGASSQYFGADAILLSLEDGGGSRPPTWDIGGGGFPALVATMVGFIRAEAPELVLTFDPRHGTTCHPDHRAIAAVVLDAVELLSDPPSVYLLETLLEVEATPLAIRFRPATSGAVRFDANQPLVATGGPAWNAVTADMGRHPSQFDAAWLGAVSSTPAADRAIYLAPASSILQRPASTCP